MAKAKLSNKNLKAGVKTNSTTHDLLKTEGTTNNIYFLLFLIGLTFAVFFPILSNDFINLDDPNYLTENPVVKSLSSDNIKAMFSNQFVGNYQPITMLCYAVEVHFFKFNPHAFHFVSLLLHLFNVVLVYLIFLKISRKAIVAFITSLLFAIHPMHVESVAWVAELKDVLYAFFALGSLFLYLIYKEKKGAKLFYILALILFALSILSKAQAVVLPMVLILIDYFMLKKINKQIILDKVPFFLISVIFGILAFIVQKKAGAVQDYNYFNFVTRILFSCYGLMNYFSKLILPIHLSCFYPYPETHDAINSNWVYISPIIILIIAAVLWWAIKNSKVIVFGILFFLITIILVLQLIPIGDAIIADRYTYLPAIGLFFIIAFYFEKHYSSYKNLKTPLLFVGIAVTILLSYLSFNRAKLWKDTISIYTDCLNNYEAAIIYNNRGASYYNLQNYQMAIKDISACLELKPRYPHAVKNRGFTYEKLNDNAKATEDFSKEIEYFPNDFNNYINRGRTLKALEKFDEAMTDYSKAIAMNDAAIDAYFGRAEIYNRRGKIQESIDDLSKIVSITPNHPEVFNNRGTMYGQLNKQELAVADFNNAIKLKPDEGGFYKNRMFARFAIKDYKGALDDALIAKQKGQFIDEGNIKQIQAMVEEGKR